MADQRNNQIECRSKEGLEADIPRRAIIYGGIGENIGNCKSDDYTKSAFDENGNDLPPNFIRVDH